MNAQIEAKHLVRPFELKQVSEAGEFEGYGSVFNVLDSDRDIVMPGAFADSLKQHASQGTMPAMLFSHNTHEPIGEWDEVKEDSIGLYVKGNLWIGRGIQKSEQAHASIMSKGKMGLSIGFRTVRDEFDREAETRKIHEVKLFEVSPTVFPANEAARVTDAKSEVTRRELERAMQDAGLTRSQARLVLKHGFDGLNTATQDAGAELDRLLGPLAEIRKSLRDFTSSAKA